MLVEYVGYTPKRVNAWLRLYEEMASEPIQPIRFSTSIIANDLEDDECSMKFCTALWVGWLVLRLAPKLHYNNASFVATPGFLIFLLNRSLHLMHHALCYALLLTAMTAFSPLF
jgi:hypothetical protein